MRKKTLAFRFISTVLLILVVVQGSLAAWQIAMERRDAAQNLQDKVKTVASLLANFSATAILSYNYAYLDQYVEAISRDEDLLWVRVNDRRGNVLRERTLRKDTGAHGINPFAIPWTNRVETPVRSGDEQVGSIEIGYSGRRANREIVGLLLFHAVTQLLVVTLMIGAISYLFQRSINGPVHALTACLARVTDGDLTGDVPAMESEEMERVATGIRYLSDRLRKMVERSHSISVNVAMAIEQLSVALRNVSDTAARQARAIDGVISAISDANDSQERVKEHAEKLSGVSAENVASLLEMKATAEEIAASTGRLFSTAESSYVMVAETARTAKMIAQHSNDVFQAVENASASVEEIGASLNEVLNHTRFSAEAALRLRQLLTDNGTLAVADAIEAMESIIDEVGRSEEIINRLDERSKNIEKILAVIKEVTEGTNLLSLNAAILASQAGEYGRSFSVVADEIKALSARTASSARDISGIVRTIKDEIREAATSIRRGVEKVGAGKNLIFRVGESMGETLEAAQRSAHMAVRIQRATDEQALGLRQITNSMENVRHMAETMVRAAEEQRGGAERISRGTGDVKEVAELVKRGTEEHAAGTRIIAKNLDLATHMVSEITVVAIEQQKTNDIVVGAVEQIRNSGVSAARDMEELTLSLGTLKDEIEHLKKEISAFKVSGYGRA